MPKINTTFEIPSYQLLGINICGPCYFKTIQFNDKPCRCKIFNKELEGYHPLPDADFYKEHKRLQECIDSEVKELKETCAKDKINEYISENFDNEALRDSYQNYQRNPRLDDCFDGGYYKGYATALLEIKEILNK